MKGSPEKIRGMLGAMAQGGWSIDDARAAFGRKEVSVEVRPDQRTRENSGAGLQREGMVSGMESRMPDRGQVH